jgi:hypothetical protein
MRLRMLLVGAMALAIGLTVNDSHYAAGIRPVRIIPDD